MKNKSQTADMILYPTVIIVGFFIRLLPAAFSLWLARGIGSLAYIFYPKRRSIGYANLKAAFSKDMPPVGIRKITILTFQHFAQVLFELFRFPSIDEKYVDRFVACEGLENVAGALKKGHGAIVLTAHFGNWEISGLAGAVKGYPQDVLARQQKYLRLNSLLNKYRERYGRHVIEKGMATRGIISAIKENRVVAILSDQDGGHSGVLVDFFGRLASTPQGAAVIVLKYDSQILPNFCARLKGPYYRMIVEKPLEYEITRDMNRDIQAVLQNFTKVLEGYIIKYPDQWLWLHKRWKTTPSRRILILSDLKAGHLNQAKAAAKQIEKVVFEKAEADERIQALRRANLCHPEPFASLPQNDMLNNLIYQEKTVEVKYKSRIHKVLLSMCSLLASSGCQGCMKCVKFCLTRDSYKNLMSVYADIIVSCGSATAVVNRFLCKENRAKGITVMKPGVLPAKKFNLCIIPRHDSPKKAPNTVAIEGALNMIDTEYKSSKVEEYKAEGSIGLLIGGNNKDFTLTAPDLAGVLDAIINISNKRGISIFATTSRRTQADIDKLVKDKLSKADNCKLLVIANEKNIPGAVSDILSSSKVVIVSGESISMISEAASSGKKTVVFKLRTKKHGSRHQKFLENMKNEGYITLCEPEGIADAVDKALKDNDPVKILNDSALVYEAVKKIV